jgi:prolyl oligopeptidase
MIGMSTGRSCRFLREDMKERRDVMPLFGEGMPVSRDVLFVLPDRLPGEGDVVLVSFHDVRVLREALDPFGADASGHGDATQGLREDIPEDREVRKVDGDVLPVERDVLFDVSGAVREGRQVIEERRHVIPESREDVPFERHVPKPLGRGVPDDRHVVFDAPEAIAERGDVVAQGGGLMADERDDGCDERARRAAARRASPPGRAGLEVVSIAILLPPGVRPECPRNLAVTTPTRLLPVARMPLLLLPLFASCAEAPPPEPASVPAPEPQAAVVASAAPKGPDYPPAPKRPVDTDYFGTKVHDDYAWLENGKDAEVMAFSDAQNKLARGWLDGLESRAAIKARITALVAASPSYFDLSWKNGVFFFMKKLPPKQQPFLLTGKSVDDLASTRVIVDPNATDPSGKTAIDWYVPSRDGKLVAVSLSSGGTEAGDVHVFDVATGKERPDVVPHVNGGTAAGSLAWNADGSGFFYTRYPHAGERAPADMDFYQQVYFHKLGQKPDLDTYAIGKDFPRIVEVTLDTSPDGRTTLARAANGDGGEFAFHLRSADGKWTQIAAYADKVVEAKFGTDGSLFLLSNAAPKRQILRLPAGATALEKAEVVVPESDVVVTTFAPTKTHLYVVDLAGGPSQLRVFPLGGKGKAAPTSIAILPVSRVSEIEAVGADDVVFANESYVDPPAFFRYAAADGKVTRTALVKTTPADMSDAKVVRETCTSKDGTKVPLNIVMKKSTTPSGGMPVLLSGYGGFGATRPPRFRPMNRLWLDQGGIFAEANLRGGGEYGEAWHKAGNLLKKQNVFDDMAACAQKLIDDHYTDASKLAILGGSNGGLLMGAELTQHPELFRAVVSSVGIYDMLHVENTSNGAFNVTEYGTVKDPAQFQTLFAYSPLHNVKDGTPYPSVLFLTGANDPRVDPYHSRKMAARLQAATSSGHPVLLRTSADTGHIGSPLAAEIEENADIYAFLFHELGVDYHAN